MTTVLTDKAWHQLPVEEVLESLGVNSSTGLSAAEVRHRQREFGPNRVTARHGIPGWIKFLQQFNQPLVYILLIAVAVTAFLG
jgi:Ca2+-transporting ATPase